VLRHVHRGLGDRRQGVAVVAVAVAVVRLVRDNHRFVGPDMVMLVVEERVAKERRSALGR
jgi:hypothetical protein